MKTGTKQNRRTCILAVSIFSVAYLARELQPDRMLKRFRLPTSDLHPPPSVSPSNQPTRISPLTTHSIRATFHNVAPSPSESMQKINVRTTDRGLRTRSFGLRTTDYELRTQPPSSFRIGFVVKPGHQQSSSVNPTKKDFCRRTIQESDLRHRAADFRIRGSNTQHVTRNTHKPPHSKIANPKRVPPISTR